MRLLDLFASISAVVAVSSASSAIYCNSSSTCPESAPCCSQYGECGTGSYCLTGCDPRYSYKKDACMPMPVCKNITTTFNSTDQFEVSDKYLGDASKFDWTYSGYLVDKDDEILLTMPNHTAGTVVSSTHFVWYGKIDATFKTSRDAGVITAYILFSNVQDEIDYEFVGKDLETAETNFYFEGVLNYTNAANASTTDTFENYHTYGVDWTEDQLDWLIDGKVVRTLKKADTYNATSNTYMYPQTPSRVQISLWPGGDPTMNAPGTVAWAGGDIDWDSTDIQEYGYYYAALQEISIQCYAPPAGTLINGTKAYVYNTSGSWGQDYVMITDDDTVLGSLDDSGLNASVGRNSTSSSSSSTSSSSASSSSSSSSSSDSSSSSSSSRSTTSHKNTTTSFSSSSTPIVTSSSKKQTTTSKDTTTSPEVTTQPTQTTVTTASSNNGFQQFSGSTTESSSKISTASNNSGHKNAISGTFTFFIISVFAILA